MSPLESESIEIIREAVAGARKPVMLYSIGKDSSVMLQLARKAFHPATPPFPPVCPGGWVSSSPPQPPTLAVTSSRRQNPTLKDTRATVH